MGSDFSVASDQEIPTLAIAAVSCITQFDEAALELLKRVFLEAEAAYGGSEADEATIEECGDETCDAAEEPRGIAPKWSASQREPKLHRSTFNSAVEHVGICTSDRAIMDRIFTMLDRTGDDMIRSEEFLVSMCALLRGDLKLKFHAALKMLLLSPQMTEAIKEPTRATRDDVFFVLHTMATCTHYFGDPSAPAADILGVVDDLFQDVKEMEVYHVAEHLAVHSTIVEFAQPELHRDSTSMPT